MDSVPTNDDRAPVYDIRAAEGQRRLTDDGQSPAPKSRRTTRRVMVVLDADDFDRLDALAAKECRDPYQQARWIIMCALDAAEVES